MKLTSKQWIGVVVAIIVVLIFFFPFFSKIFFSDSSVSEFNNLNFLMSEREQESGSVEVKDISIGSGPEATPGKNVVVHYTGRLEDGTVFDSSVSRGIPFQFVLGIGRVIKGWDIGVNGMRVGGKRELIISPEMAYGESGIRDPQTGQVIIPENATLYFEVELLEVQDL